MATYPAMCDLSGCRRCVRQQRVACYVTFEAGRRLRAPGAVSLAREADLNSAVAEKEHPARAAAIAELHARPAPRVDPTGHVTRLVYALDEGRARTLPRRIDIICKAQGVAPPSAQARYHSIIIEGRELRWERHTEFVSYTFVSPGDGRSELIWRRLTEDPEVQAIAGPLAARIAIAVKPHVAGGRRRRRTRRLFIPRDGRPRAHLHRFPRRPARVRAL